MSSLISKNLQVGADLTASNNFTIYQPASPDGTLRIGNGNTGITSSLLTLTSAGQVQLGAGSASAPVISPSGDTNTGIFFPAADTIAFAEGGAEVMRINSSGNLGIQVVPKTFNTVDGATQVGTNFTITSFNNDSGIGYNHYYSSGWKYTNAGVASRFSSTSTIPFLWQYVASGSADGSITWSEAMRIDSSGNVGIAVTPSAWGSGWRGVQFGASGAAISGNYSAIGVHITGNTYFDGTNWKYLADGLVTDYYQNAGIHAWRSADTGTAGNNVTWTERARITSGGYFKASNSGSYINSTGAYHEIVTNETNASALMVYASSNSYAYTSSGLLMARAARNTTNNTFYAIGYYNEGANANKFLVADSGNVTNTNGTYGTISDAKLKQDIVDAGNQWDDIKNLRFRKYRFKSDVELDPNAKPLLGLVAQEAELVSPGLIEEHTDQDQEGNNLGTTTKSIKTSILYMKAVKALQEAQLRIESLEARLAALEAK